MIHETLNTQANSSLQIHDLKGEVTVQLFNAKTGKLEKEVKGENMVTNAVKDIFAANYLGVMDYSKLMPIATTLLGGVLCYEQQQTESATNYYPPLSSDNAIIAHAGQTTYSSADIDTTRGLPNDGESMVIPASGNTPLGYKHVFDFPTTQGNGVIRSVSLTHKDFGDWAWKGGTSFNPVESLGTISSSTNVYQPYFYNETKREAYMFDRDGSTKLRMHVYADSSRKSTIGLTQKFPTATPFSANVIETVEVTVTDVGATYVMYLDEAQEVHVLYPHGNTIDRTIIDLTDFSKITSNLTTPYNNMTAGGQGGSLAPKTMEIDDDGYVYIPVTDGIQRQKYSNMADHEHSTVSWGAPGYYSTMGVGHHGLLPLRQGIGIVDGDTAYQCAYPWGESDVDYFKANCARLGKAPVFFRSVSRYSYDSTLYLWKPYLGTIFNLSSPIIKTAQQTMKITYTISETIN